MTKDHRLDISQWLDYSREKFEGCSHDYEFVAVTDIQLRSEPSLVYFTKGNIKY